VEDGVARKTKLGYQSWGEVGFMRSASIGRGEEKRREGDLEGRIIDIPVSERRKNAGQ